LGPRKSCFRPTDPGSINGRKRAARRFLRSA
jgi:hypothetical protein